jgi:hypothetical protein
MSVSNCRNACRFHRLAWAGAALVFLVSLSAWSHGVADEDKAFFAQATGLHLLPFIYLGAKHMVTGYDHLLFLVAVVFFLYRLRDVAAYVTLFALGHSVTLLFGVLSGVNVNAYLVDAIIGLSVVYKAFDNLGGFQQLLGFQPNNRIAVLVFGFFHGFGLAAKLREMTVSQEGLVPNILAFNVGVEIGQLLALSAVLIAMGFWRRSPAFGRHSFVANAALMTAGFVLMGYQMVGYVLAGNGLA